MFFRNDSISFPEGRFRLKLDDNFKRYRPYNERKFIGRVETDYESLEILEAFMEAIPIRDHLHLIGSPRNGYFLARQDQRDGYYYPPVGQIEFL